MKKNLILTVVLFVMTISGWAAEPRARVQPIKLMVTNQEAGFVCLVSDDGKIFWKKGVDSFKDLRAAFHLDNNSRYVAIEIQPDNGKTYPYLYPEKHWKMLTYGMPTPVWFTARLQNSVWKEHVKWVKMVYGMFDYQGVRDLTVKQTIDVSNKKGKTYIPTDEDIQAFLAFIQLHDQLSTSIRTSIRNTIDAQIGASVSNDIWNYVTRDVGEDIKAAGDIGDKLRELGASNNGSVQNDFNGALVGSFFRHSIKKWDYFAGDTARYPYQSAIYLWKHGLAVSEDSSEVWRLHLAGGGRILYSIPNEKVSQKKAFSCIVAKDGHVYWKQALDNTVALASYYGLGSGDYVAVQVKPVLDHATASLSLPDGLNPTVARFFPYLDQKAVWTLTVLNSPAPDWFGNTSRKSVRNAFNQWRTNVFNHFQLARVTNVFTKESQSVSSYSDSDIHLLKAWAQTWRSLTDQHKNPTAAIKLTGYKTIGASVWDDLDAYLLAAWRVQHTACPGDIVSASYFSAKGVTDPQNYDHAVGDVVGDSVSDAMEALAGSFFPGITHWEYFPDHTEEYPYAAAAELISKGLIPFTDGTDWYLGSGKDATIVFRISEEDLLAVTNK